ncbi:MAG: TonB-dependent receptor [Sphingobacteriia bacterium]|nr:MAG: TonB-dependent receptor [Sphingobacteriia bacterium]
MVVQSIIMRIIYCLFYFLSFSGACQPKSRAVQQKLKNVFADSADFELWKSSLDLHLNDEAHSTEESDSHHSFTPSILQSSKDLFTSASAFYFSIRRFRARGLPSSAFTVALNEIPMNQFTDGNANWNSWGGLNEVANNSQLAVGLRDNEYAFGSMGSAQFIQLKASRLWPQTTLSLNFSNRNYQYRLAFTKVVSFNKKGWAFALSASARLGNQPVFVGTMFQSIAYFLGVDKKINTHLLSLNLIGNRQYSTRVPAVTKEMIQLYGSEQYNPSWGMQQQQPRNANLQFIHLPILIFSHEFKPNDQSFLVTSIAFSKGEKYATGLDWFNAADPRPDYYRYLPSFQQDSLLKNTLQTTLQNDPALLQVDWQRMYAVNHNSSVDKRARYIVEDRVEQQKRLVFFSRFSGNINDRFYYTARIGYQYQLYRYTKRVNDLLGAQYYIDWNQFADDNTPNNMARQNDLNRPDRILLKGDYFGYDYQFKIQQFSVFSQSVYKWNKLDLFAAAELKEVIYQREGLVRNGVFPLNSFGLSTANIFSDYAFKAGITYKHNGRNYFYCYASIFSKPPLMNDWFISPRTNDATQSAIAMEKSRMIEAGYTLNSPAIKLRVNIYAAQFYNGMDVMSFYHDGYRNLVNYALSNIAQTHIGTTISGEYQVTNTISLIAALAFGRYQYSNRPNYQVRIDTENFITEEGLVYINRFPITGTPQKAFTMSIQYRSPRNVFISFTGSYMGSHFISFNPLRRTYEALRNLPAGESSSAIILPEQLPNLFVADVSAGYSFRLLKKKSGASLYLQSFLSINNLFNRPIITGGYEQLRYDAANASTQKFPAKYYYSPLTNYSLSIRFKQ